MSIELNTSEKYSITLPEISLHTSSSYSITTDHVDQSLYKEEFIYSTVDIGINEFNPKKVWTVIADTSAYKSFGFYFNGYISRSNNNFQSSLVRWGVGYNVYASTFYNDGLDSESAGQPGVYSTAPEDNYVELSTGSPNKFEFYMALRGISINISYVVVGNLQIFANYNIEGI